MNIPAIISTTSALMYALLSTIYKSAQVIHSLRVDAAQINPKGSGLPDVDIVVPCFNEDPATLRACLASIATQEYAGALKVYVVDDGSSNRDTLKMVYREYGHDARFNFLLLPRNLGKRKAQVAAIRSSSGELILNVDSDTTLAPDAVRKLALTMSDVNVGAAMGQLTASNRNDTWLTRLIDMEYWLACNEERAAQARFGAVMCCCGPCAIYRRSALLSLLDQYETQLFRGKRSDFGEDRHLTILMLSAGYRTEYVPGAIAATVVPDKLWPYLRQQLRWARSTYRDTLLALRLLPRLDGYLTLDVVAQNVGALLLAVSTITGMIQLAVTNTTPWQPFLVIASMAVVRSTVAAIRARQLRFLGFAMHTVINILLLIPVKIYALFTLSNSDWLSREGALGTSKDQRKHISLPEQPTATSNADSNSTAAQFNHNSRACAPNSYDSSGNASVATDA
ncbi:chitooligosaccharide synthase NodC [Cupriavidus consociatus]|uniref:chitooligosaccharide synthase NodC n=1 Tax=Cupriavidus consociatus TaxID=2821357 RepID=UPI001AE6B71E|nr:MULTISPECIES: chitooligosaccharide synthase NodC [unclassified Cupriavidus]MBP0625148.1 chitooligosaccharide synthase NodC [Cupriavidus sp. LEh25]MDK2661887.1 chitooligosaccharide synthase NodC [Cupriavidus sp. LEh21]